LPPIVLRFVAMALGFKGAVLVVMPVARFADFTVPIFTMQVIATWTKARTDALAHVGVDRVHVAANCQVLLCCGPTAYYTG